MATRLLLGRSVTDQNPIVLRAAAPSGLDPLTVSQWDLGFPAVRASVSDLPGRSGTDDQTFYTGARTVTLDVKLLHDNLLQLDRSTGDTVVVSSKLEHNIDMLRSLAHPRNTPVLYLYHEDWPSERRMVLRGTSIGLVKNRTSVGMQTASMEFVCPSGFLESADEYDQVIHPYTASSGGFTFSGSFSMTFGLGGVSSIRTIEVAGTEPTAPLLRITGACVGPKITLRHTDAPDEIISFPSLSLSATDILTINMATQEVKIGSNDYYTKINFSESSWWSLQPGTNEVSFAPASADINCSLTILYRDKWV